MLASSIVCISRDNSQCAKWCHDTFPFSQAPITAYMCTSLAARGEGPCYVCGPAAAHTSGTIDIDACTIQSGCCTPDAPTCCTDATRQSECVNLQSNINNCGSCGNVCDIGQGCEEGSCKVSCPNDTPQHFFAGVPQCFQNECVSSPSECCEICRTMSFSAENGYNGFQGCEGRPCDGYFVQLDPMIPGTCSFQQVGKPYSCLTYGLTKGTCPLDLNLNQGSSISYCMSSL